MQQAARVADALGGQTETWQTLATVWAHLAPATASPVNRADGEEAEITHRVILRADDRVREACGSAAGDASSRSARFAISTRPAAIWLCLTREETS